MFAEILSWQSVSGLDVCCKHSLLRGCIIALSMFKLQDKLCRPSLYSLPYWVSSCSVYWFYVWDLRGLVLAALNKSSASCRRRLGVKAAGRVEDIYWAAINTFIQTQNTFASLSVVVRFLQGSIRQFKLCFCFDGRARKWCLLWQFKVATSARLVQSFPRISAPVSWTDTDSSVFALQCYDSGWNEHFPFVRISSSVFLGGRWETVPARPQMNSPGSREARAARQCNYLFIFWLLFQLLLIKGAITVTASDAARRRAAIFSV